MKEHSAIFELLLISTMLTFSCSKIISLSPRQARLSLAAPMPYYFHNDVDGHPGTYSYGYDVIDPATGNNQFRTEERYPNGTVVGSYGYMDSWGRPQRYRYVADVRGYRVVKERPYRPYSPPSIDLSPYPSYPTETSVTWTRPKKPYKKKNNKYFVNRPNLVGPPSSYAED